MYLTVLIGPWEACDFENLTEMTEKPQPSCENNSWLIRHLCSPVVPPALLWRCYCWECNLWSGHLKMLRLGIVEMGRFGNGVVTLVTTSPHVAKCEWQNLVRRLKTLTLFWEGPGESGVWALFLDESWREHSLTNILWTVKSEWWSLLTWGVRFLLRLNGDLGKQTWEIAGKKMAGHFNYRQLAWEFLLFFFFLVFIFLFIYF